MGGNSFPASHAAQAFSLAIVYSNEYGGLVTVGAYGLASLIALARLRGDYHRTSDIVGGVLIGTGVAGFLCRLHRKGNRPSASILSNLYLMPRAGTPGMIVRIRTP